MEMVLKGEDDMFFAGQLEGFIIAIVTGAFLGVLFDLYRMVRRVTKPRHLITSLADLLYWLAATIIVFFALLAGNWGELRLYIFLGLLAGGLFYYRFFSNATIRLLIMLFRLGGKVIAGLKLIICFLLRPFVFFIKLLGRPVRFVRRKITARKTSPEDIIPPL